MTRPPNAAAAAHAGADAIGLVFYPAAPRCVSLDQARHILAAVPPFVTPVGLFVDSPAEEILEIAKTLNLRHVQLHGHEAPQVVAQLNGLQVLKALHVDPLHLRERLSTWRTAIADLHLNNLAGLLLETANTAGLGGTGVENDWTTIVTMKESGAFDGLPPLIAAGGLTPGNVADVVRRLRPFAVDVSSGIEITRGVKSAQKMQAFTAAVREADART